MSVLEARRTSSVRGSRQIAATRVNVSCVSDGSGDCFATGVKELGANKVGMRLLLATKLLRMVCISSINMPVADPSSVKKLCGVDFLTSMMLT